MAEPAILTSGFGTLAGSRSRRVRTSAAAPSATGATSNILGDSPDFVYVSGFMAFWNMALGLPAPLACAVSAKPAKPSAGTPYSCIYRFISKAAWSLGVSPCIDSKSESDAVARASSTPAPTWSVNFSTPTTRAVSTSPLLMAK